MNGRTFSTNPRKRGKATTATTITPLPGPVLSQQDDTNIPCFHAAVSFLDTLISAFDINVTHDSEHLM